MPYLLLTLGLISLYGVFHRRAMRFNDKRPWSGDVRTDIPRTYAEFVRLLATAHVAMAAQVDRANTIKSRPLASVHDGWLSDSNVLSRWHDEDEDADSASTDRAAPNPYKGVGPTM